MFVKIFGVILVIAGIFMAIKVEWFMQNFGSIAWAEEHFGGSRFFYKVLGIVLIFFGFSMFFGLFGDMATWVFSPLMPNR